MPHFDYFYNVFGNVETREIVFVQVLGEYILIIYSALANNDELYVV